MQFAENRAEQLRWEGSRWKASAPGPVPPQPSCVCLPPRRAFQQFYKQFVEYTCPTEDIYLE